MDSITIIGWIITIVGIIYMVSDKSSGARPYNDDDWYTAVSDRFYR